MCPITADCWISCFNTPPFSCIYPSPSPASLFPIDDCCVAFCLLHSNAPSQTALKLTHKFMGECRRCTSNARRRQAGGLQKDQAVRVRWRGTVGCWLLAVAEAAGHCDAFEHGLLDVASLVGSNVAAVVGGSVGGGWIGWWRKVVVGRGAAEALSGFVVRRSWSSVVDDEDGAWITTGSLKKTWFTQVYSWFT